MSPIAGVVGLLKGQRNVLKVQMFAHIGHPNQICTQEQNRDAVIHLFAPDPGTEKWMRELVGLIMGGMHKLCKKQAMRLLDGGELNNLTGAALSLAKAMPPTSNLCEAGLGVSDRVYEVAPRRRWDTIGGMLSFSFN